MGEGGEAGCDGHFIEREWRWGGLEIGGDGDCRRMRQRVGSRTLCFLVLCTEEGNLGMCKP